MAPTDTPGDAALRKAGPGPDPVEGPSFPPTVKGLATLLVVALLVQGWQAAGRRPWQHLDWPVGLFLLAAIGVIAAGYWGILTSRTRIDGRCIRQSWLWSKEVALADITQVKLLEVPRLSWLVVPRLVVRSGSLHLTTFHAADARVLAALRRFAHGGEA